MPGSILEELESPGYQDAVFNARAPQPPDRIPTYREYKFHNTTWMIIGFLVSFIWVSFAGAFVFPMGFGLSLAMGFLLRDHARGARHPFEFPLFIVISVLGALVGGVLNYFRVLY